MMIHEITAKAGTYKARKRVGRGRGSGSGKTAGRGYKGAGSRSGTARKKAFEGGQMPLFRRLRKYGFSNARFEEVYWIVNLKDILAHPAFAKGGTVDASSLTKAGLIRDGSRNLKVLGTAPEKGVSVKLNIVANRVSASAKKLVVDAGGSVNQTGTLRDKNRGVDRNSDDLSPKNLTKKLKRGSKKTADKIAEAEGAAEKAAGAEKAPAAKKAEKPAKGDKAAE